MKWHLLLEPVDVWLFRDGRPFVAGEAHRARSIFPPTPYTLQGAIRAKVLFDASVDLMEYAHQSSEAARELARRIGAPGRGYGQLRITGPVLARSTNGQVTLYYPVPADMVKIPAENDGETTDTVKITATTLQPLGKDFMMEDFSDIRAPALQFLWAPRFHIESVGGWIAASDFEKYLANSGKDFQVTIYRNSFFFQTERRVGIQINPDRLTTEEGRIYHADFLRFTPGTSLVVQIAGIEPFAPRTGYLQLGGEARAAYYTVEQQPLSGWFLNRSVLNNATFSGRFKMIFLTPAYFRHGWHPEDWSTFFQNASVRCVGAAIPGTQMIGGAVVDDRRRSRNFERTAYRFLPAGSVLFFEADQPISYNGQPITETPEDSDGDLQHIGFGSVVIAPY